MKIQPVILCGGSGTRLWPESRELFPKQFIPILNQDSLFDITLKRLSLIHNCKKPIIVTNEKYNFLVRDVLHKLNIEATIILEPIGRNTAPAIYLASSFSKKSDTLLVLPADHYIGNNKLFIKSLNYVFKMNNINDWITLGITPTSPSTSYGYIKIDEKSSNNKIFKVEKFIEKPKTNLAKKLYKSQHFWNSGIFIGNSNMILKSIRKHAPNLAQKCDLTLNNVKKTKNNEYLFELKLFNKIPAISIDFSIIEKSKNVLCHPISCEWNDIGSWEKFFENIPFKNKPKKVIQVRSKNNFIKTKNRLIATIGINDLIIVDTNDATLIAKKGLEEKMRDITSILTKNNHSELKENLFETRPWGKFETLHASENLKIKKITVKPKSRLSKQFHYFRSEHWFITYGKASIYKDGEIFKLKKGQSIDIPKKSIHYIENTTNEELIFIELQMGTYFGEDDIIRLDDIYGRK